MLVSANLGWPTTVERRPISSIKSFIGYQPEDPQSWNLIQYTLKKEPFCYILSHCSSAQQGRCHLQTHREEFDLQVQPEGRHRRCRPLLGFSNRGLLGFLNRGHLIFFAAHRLGTEQSWEVEKGIYQVMCGMVLSVFGF
jgi:hypothetical protein